MRIPAALAAAVLVGLIAAPTAQAADNPIDLTATPSSPSAVDLSWNPDLTDVTYARNGEDTSRTGDWTGHAGNSDGEDLTRLQAGKDYRFTVTGKLDGRKVAQTVTYTVPGNAEVSTQPVTETTPASDATTGPLNWISGASGPDIGSGVFGNWRGLDVPLAATWADNPTAAQTFGQLDPGGEYGAWGGSLNVAVGFGGTDTTWAKAAAGDADGPWRKSLRTLGEKWGKLPHQDGATLYIRFAHEANGDWYDWRFAGSNPNDVKAAWVRYSNMAHDIIPGVKLVFSMNKDSVGLGRAWTDFWPGSEAAQILDADVYDSGRAWVDELNLREGDGAPIGVGAYLDQARAFGVPFGVSEWSGRFNVEGDDPSWFEGMHAFFKENGRGWRAGSALYEIGYNDTVNDRNFNVYGDTNGPKSAEVYRQLW